MDHISKEPEMSTNRRRRAGLRLAFIALLAAATLSIQTLGAEAHTITGTGSYGRISPIPAVTINGTHNYSCPITFAPFTVARSTNYAGTQIIKVVEFIFIDRFNYQGWQNYASNSYFSYASAGQALYGYGSTRYVECGRAYHIEIVVEWDTAGGSFLGRTFYDYNSPNDYTRVGYTLSGSAEGWLYVDPV
jgi:hypothetical protein